MKNKKIVAVCNACFDKQESNMIGEKCIQFIKTFPEDKMIPKKCQGKYIPFRNGESKKI